MIADEPIVTEGPGVYPEDETVATKDLPYAMKLYRWLNEHGARVSYRATCMFDMSSVIRPARMIFVSAGSCW